MINNIKDFYKKKKMNVSIKHADKLFYLTFTEDNLKYTAIVEEDDVNKKVLEDVLEKVNKRFKEQQSIIKERKKEKLHITQTQFQKLKMDEIKKKYNKITFDNDIDRTAIKSFGYTEETGNPVIRYTYNGEYKKIYDLNNVNSTTKNGIEQQIQDTTFFTLNYVLYLQEQLTKEKNNE